MTVTALLNDLALVGIRVVLREERLRYAPKSAMTPDLLSRMRAQKPELIAVLSGEQTPPDSDWDAVPDWHELHDPGDGCPACGSILFRWDLRGNRHCMLCDPGQSERVRSTIREL